MAMRGRFASGGTGGSSLSMLVYNIMRQQYSRQVSSIISAYQNGSDFMGEGVPSADRVVAYLQEYAQRPWLTAYERQQITDQIKQVRDLENQRQGTILANAVNQDPTNVQAVKDYIAYLQNNIARAGTAVEKATAQSQLYDAQGKLVDALAGSLQNNIISNDVYNQEIQSVLSTYEKGSPQYQTLLTSSFEKQYQALQVAEYTKVVTAKAKGDAAYAKAMQVYLDWMKNERQLAADAGLAGLDGKGNIITGSDGILGIQENIANAEGALKQLNQGLAIASATNRVNGIVKATTPLLEMVNSVLGSNYNDITKFMQNQMDVNRFYANVPGTMQMSNGFMSKEALTNLVFGGGSSLINSAKNAGAAGSGLYSNLAGIGKNYGVNSSIDEAAVLFNRWSEATALAHGDALKLGSLNDMLINDYQQLINNSKGKISETELAVHQRTLDAIIAARSGKEMPFDGLSAWDLANPSSLDYNQSTGQTSRYFDNVLKVMASDANIESQVKAGGAQILRPNSQGGWDFGAVVDPMSSGAMSRLVKYGTGFYAGVLEGVPILYKDPNNASKTSEVIGYYYDLGNGSFQVRDAKTNDIYSENYDPISGKAMTANDFKKSYIHTTVTQDTTGTSTGSVTPMFQVGTSFVTPDAANTTDAGSVLTGALDLELKKIDRQYDSSTAAQIKGNLIQDAASKFSDPAQQNLIVSKYQAQLSAQSVSVGGTGSKAMISSAPGGGGLSSSSGYVTPPRMSFNDGQTLGYFFRNTPLSTTVSNLGNASGNVGTGGRPLSTNIAL